jgi:signal transduction histidine kinase
LAAVLLLFTTVFPKSKFGALPKKAILILSPAIFLATLQIWYFLKAVQTNSAEVFGFYQRSFDAFHVAFFLYGGISLVNFIHSYRASETIEEKKKFQWILWGFVIGAAPFLLLVVLPQMFFPASLIPEEFAIIFVICIPLSFAVSVLKYRLFDIEVIINRSIAYTILSLIVAVVYVFSVLLMTSLIGGQRVFEEYLLLVGVSLVVAFLFNPLRNHVQRFVDETLFPAKGMFRKLTMELSAEFHHSLSTDQLLSRVVAGLERLIPATTVAVYTYEPPSMSLQSIRGVPLKESFHLSKENASMIAHPRIYALPGAVNFSREDVDGSFEAMLVRLGISVCLPLVSESRELLGVLAIGSHPEKGRFSEEEVDLLATVAHQAEDVLERLVFQERMIIERDQKRRAEEMSRMKSYLVSSVSHELRTPLTSIRMFAETLGSTAGKNKKLRKEYLEIIEGESVRLAHLIDNILDSAKIERGVQEYKFERIKLSEVIRRALQATAYLVKSTETKLRVRAPKKLPSLLADGDALEEALINLITNSVKYSPERKEVSVIVTNKRNSICVEVADRGAGISADDLPRIFDSFYRAHRDGARVHGSGLGLSLVKHIVEAHQGTVQVESTVGHGSRFKIHLPVRKG